MKALDQFIANFASFVWGLPLLVLVLGGGLFFIFKSRFLPYRYLGHAIQILRGKYDKPDDPGQINHFQALTTALAATVGMGNIAGVAVAIHIGGPGAIFWMWVSGVLGMATKFFTCTLAILFRGKDSEGELQGGPMYFITEGLGRRWKPLASFFCLAGLVGALPVFNVNQLTQAINDILLTPAGIENSFGTNLMIGLFLVALAGTVILGGIKRIGHVTSRLVPVMVVLYFLAVLAILIVHIDQLPHYLGLIFTDAFAANHYSGDAKIGGILGALIILGTRRGAFSNEAGIGTAPMAHGAAKTAEPVREGLVAMLGPAIDTLVVCTMTALAILVTNVWQHSGDANGVTLTLLAFDEALPFVGKYLLMICIAVFSISSLFSFSYYGTKCLSFLTSVQTSKLYNYFYLFSILIGATFGLDIILNLIDGFYALMAIPTMIGAILLSSKVVEAYKKYFAGLED